PCSSALEPLLEPLGLTYALGMLATLMPVERVDLDRGVCRRQVVVCGEHARREYDAVHQAHREQRWRGDAAGEVDPVEVRQRLEYLVDAITVHREVALDLTVGVVGRLLDRSAEVA